MAVAAIVTDLADRGVELQVQDDELRCSPRSAVTLELLASMTRLKAELLDAVVEGFGKVPAGWSQKGWKQHLQLTSEACQPNHPERSDYFQRWAQAIKP